MTEGSFNLPEDPPHIVLEVWIRVRFVIESITMTETSSRRRQHLQEQLLANAIDRVTYEELIAELDKSDTGSIVSASLIVEPSDSVPDVIIASSGPDAAKGSLNQPIALVGPGIELGGFRIEKSIGRGGMGEVWRAQDLVGERHVVIKLLHPEFVNHPEELAAVKETFQRVHRLQHENICPVYLLGQDVRFGYYVVMKYIDGITLSMYRRKFLQSHAAFTVSEVARILGPVARALDYAHTQRIVHCDVKPQNIMISREGTVELVDFGLAAEIRSSASRISTTSMEYGGTYPYMSPEQWRGEILDGRSDQYSLAIVAYELLAGHRPFQSSDPEVLRVCALKETPPSITVQRSANGQSNRDSVDCRVDMTLARALSKARSDRFRSCTEFITTLCDSNFDPPSNARTRRVPRSQWKEDSPIAAANRKALVWFGWIGGSAVVALFGFTIWFLSHLISPRGMTVITQLRDQSAAHQNVPKPAPIESALRYRWQPDRAYVYSVSLDIDQDQDRVVTLAGDLAWTVTAPVSDPEPANQETRATGTAFVVHPDGYLLTCHHVTDGALTIEVAIGGESYPASLIVDDAEHDLALIRIEANSLPVLPLADSLMVEQGEDVRAIGFPLSSILGENIKATRGTIAGINQEEGKTVFQIDAAVNPGNSGGPLVNEQGEVVGVIFAKLVDNVATSVGFATPINDAKTMLSSQSVSFTPGNSKERLAGPALIKRVAAATALVTVQSRGATLSQRGRVSIGCEGTLHPRSWRRSGQPGDSVEQLTWGRPLSFSTAQAETSGRIETDSMGRILASTGQGHLPNFLGQAVRLIVENMPTGRQKTWSVSHATTLTVQHERENNDPRPWGPRFGPRRIGPGFPFGPAPFGFGEIRSEPVVKTYPGTVQITYELKQLVDQMQTIHKSYDLKTDEALGGGPRIHLKADGIFVINTATGLPQEFEMSAQLVENEIDKSTTTPMKLKYRFIEERPLPESERRRNQVAPPPVSTPGQAVEENAALKVGEKLLCEWSGQWKRVVVLSLNDDGCIRIHWEGWSDQWDEDVTRSRLRYLPK